MTHEGETMDHEGESIKGIFNLRGGKDAGKRRSMT
jgi:hypothetical protein